MRDNHQTCDLCDITFDTPIELREHNKQVHKAPKGTAYSCDDCGFSALNRCHLRKHNRRHHQEISCNTCDFKTRNEHHMGEHKKEHKKEVTCRFWRKGNCRKTAKDCEFKHEPIQCKFGLSCRRGETCRFEHPNNRNSETPVWENQQNENQWNNPAFGNQAEYNANFPFLVQALWQMATRNRGI